MKVRVPVDVAPFVTGAHVVRALGTSSLADAKRLHPHKLAEIEHGFQELRTRLAGTDRVRVALHAGRIEHLRDRDIATLVHDWVARRGAHLAPLDATEAAELRDEFAELEAHLLDTAPYAPDPAQRMADMILIQAGFPTRKIGRLKRAIATPVLDRTSDQYAYLVALVRRALVGDAQQALIAAGGKPRFTDPAGGETVLRGRTVGALIDSYSAARSEAYGEESTKRKRSLGFRALLEVLDPESAACGVTEQEAQTIVRLLASTPSNATKKLGKVTVREAAAVAAEKGLPLLAPTTVTEHVQGLRAMFAWAEEQGGWGINRNPFRNVRTSRARQVRRRAFTPKELTTLFAALAPFKERRPTRFWVPALALYTGMRMNEACQLYRTDLVDIDGVKCLNLSEFDQAGRRSPDKRLKTQTSERYVPLHKALLDAGFVEYVANQTEGGRLFPDLTLGPDGRYSHGFSKWFGAFKRTCGFDQPALVFHSFRHGFRDACRDADISQDDALALGGWAHENQASKYGDRGRVAVLDRAVQKLRFGEFRLP